MFRLRGHLELLLSAQLLVGCWVSSVQLCNGLPAAAQSADEHSAGSQPLSATAASSLELDLQSQTASISGSLLGHSDVHVDFGGTSTIVNSSSMLTPAQYLAALSVITSGQQTLSVNTSGQAVGGSFQLPSGNNLASLLVPAGVTGIYDYASGQNLNLSGNFANNGNFYLVSSNQAINSGSLSALNIINSQGALLSSILPSGGIAGLSSLVSNFSFSLNAVNNITNLGTIASAGSLSMTAGNQILNGVSSNVMANITAMTSLSMIAPNIINQGNITASLSSLNVQSANLVNSGLLRAANGDLGISSLLNNVLSVNNIGGLIEAQNNLSFSNSLGSRSSIVIDGGVLSANIVNFDDARGSVSVSVDDISSNLNFSARNISLDVANGSSGLLLSGLSSARSVSLAYNGEGNIISSGFNTRGGDVSINTSGSVVISGSINSRPSGSGEGGSVLINAGGNIDMGGINLQGRRASGGNLELFSGANISAGNITASAGKSGNGGNITISAVGNLALRDLSSNGAGGGDGGSITLSSGRDLSLQNVVSKGNGGGAGGDLRLSASGNLSLRNITNTGSGGDGGDVHLSAFGNLSLNNITSSGTGGGNGGDLILSAGSNLSLNRIVSRGSKDGDGGSAAVSALGNVSLGAVNLSGAGQGDGGDLLIVSGSNLSTGNLVSKSGSLGDGGDMLIIAAQNISTGNIRSSASGGGDAGSITISSGAQVSSKSINATAAGGGNGGNVSVSAFQDLNTGNISSNAGGSGDGGNITLSAGHTVNTQILNASGGSDGDPGRISIVAGSSGSGTVNAKSASSNGSEGGGQISISTPGAINVSGTISAIDGSITLDSKSSNIGSIAIGDGQLNISTRGDANDDHPYILNLSQLSSYGASSLNISGSSDIVLNNNCNQCFSNLSNLTLTTSGSFTATGTTLTLDEGQTFTVNATGGINTGSVNGSGNVSFLSSGSVTVDGNINLSGGNLTLGGSGFNINSSINVAEGSVTLQTTAPSSSVSGSQLGNISAGTLNVLGNSAQQEFSIIGNANLSQISNEVNFNLAGNFTSSESELNLGSQTALNVQANNIKLGSISGGSKVNAAAQGLLALNGTINLAAGAVELNADLAGSGAALTLASGSSINAGSISLSSQTGDIVSAASMNSRLGDITVSAGSALSFLENSKLSSAANLSLSSGSNLSVGENSSLSAGSLSSTSFNPFASREAFNPALVSKSGNIILDSYRGGDASGSIEIGSGVSMVAAGVNGSGSLGILSGEDITVASGAGLASVGGNLWLSAASDVSIDGAQLVSLASKQTSAGTPYSGGQIGIMAGAADTDMNALLAGLSAARNSSQQIHSDIRLNGNFISMQNGSSLTVIQPVDHLISLNNNNINLNGGVLFIDPPPSSTVTISNTNISAAGPGIASAPLVIEPNTPGTPPPVNTPPPVVNTPTSGGATGPAAVTGSFLSASSVPSSSINQNDVQNRSVSVDQGQSRGTGYRGQSLVPSDTLDDDAPGKSGLKPAIFCSKPQLLRSSDITEEESWIIASSSCQPFTFEEHDGSLIVGTGPAKLAPTQDRTLLLREGKILVITVDKIHVVRTPYCNITIPVNTAAIVEADTIGIVRVANLAGGKASVTICRSDETLILSSSPGEQLVLAESSVPEDSFAAVSYEEVTHSKVASWNLELAGLRGQKIRFDRQEMAQHEPLLHCSMGCINQVQLRRLQQLMHSMTSAEGQMSLKSMHRPDKQKRLIEGPLPVAVKEMRPISFSDELQGELCFNTLNAGSALVKYAGRCKISLSSPGLINLEEGEALVAAKKKTIIKSGDAKVEIKPGTLAVVAKQDGLLKVRNLYEKRGLSVLTTINGKRSIGLEVAQELLVGPKGISLSRALSQDPVGRRRVHSLDLASGHTCISSEFSLSSFMQNSSILSQILRSYDNSDRQIAIKLMKMSVCVTMATSGHGNYSMISH